MYPRPVFREQIENAVFKMKHKGFRPSKWATFYLWLFDQGFRVSVYRAKTTVSKYVYAEKDGKTAKIRFSEHPTLCDKFPAKVDIDLHVGPRPDGSWFTTEQAKIAILREIGATDNIFAFL